MSLYIPHGAAISWAETTFQMRKDCVRGHIMQQHGQAGAYNIIVQLIEVKLNSRYRNYPPSPNHPNSMNRLYFLMFLEKWSACVVRESGLKYLQGSNKHRKVRKT